MLEGEAWNGDTVGGGSWLTCRIRVCNPVVVIESDQVSGRVVEESCIETDRGGGDAGLDTGTLCSGTVNITIVGIRATDESQGNGSE